MNMEKNENKHNPRIVIAMDSFKGCLSSIEAGLAVKAGLERTLSDAYAEVFRISDGGEGLVDALAGSIGGEPGTDSGEGVPFISFKIMVFLHVLPSF